MFDPSLDSGVFFKDFGVPVVWKDVETLGIMDAPDQAAEVGYTVMGNDYSVVYASADLPDVVNRDPIRVDGQDYIVRDTASIDDGAFTRATLEKV